MPRLLYVVTHPASAQHLLRGQLADMQQRGYSVALAVAPGPELAGVADREGVAVHAVPMQREVAPAADLRALGSLVRLMRRWRPDVVNAGTPKAGLLGMMAARLVGVPARVYVLRGLRLETTRGVRRWVLTATERIATACAHRVVCVSPSLADRLVAERLAPPHKVVVLGHGSSAGVEAARFQRPAAETAALRQALGLPEGAPVVGYAGRLTRDKGTDSLIRAFDRVRDVYPDARLLLVGDAEAGDPVAPDTAARLASDPALLVTGIVPDAAPYYPLMDVLAFPSHREGFPNVVLEAASAGVPAVAAAATGTVDAVVDGATGRLVPVGDADALARGLLEYLADPGLRAAHGAAARARATADFAPERLRDALAALYAEVEAEAAARRLARTDAARRTLDLLVASAGLVVLAPVLAVVAAAVRWRLGAPVLFRQVRPGRDERPFELIKFRTMTDARSPDGALRPDGERLTRLGRWLRRTSLDELPELWNVVRGEMALVGPRPLLVRYLPHYTARERRRHDVRPGITGLAQIRGRNDARWEDRFRLDVWYVEHRSVALDLRILALTVRAVLGGRGARPDPYAGSILRDLDEERRHSPGR